MDYQRQIIKCSNEEQECYQDSGTGKVICRTIIDDDKLIENIKKMKKNKHTNDDSENLPPFQIVK